MSKFVGKEVFFRFLWYGQILANLGDILYIVSLIKLIYDKTGSATYMSLVPFFSTISALISGLLAPLIINKFKLKSILTYSQTGKTVFLFLLCISIPILEEQLLFLVYLMISLISFLDGWASPARNALIPSLVEESKLVKTNSLLSISDQIIQLITWPMGSILLVSFGPVTILWQTFFLFLISTMFMRMIRDYSNQLIHEKKSQINVLKEGWAIIWHSKQLRIISLMNILETFANGVWIAAILFVYVSEALNKGENWWGYINGSFFTGMLVGGLFIYHYSYLVERFLSKIILWSAFTLTGITFLFGTTSIPWFALFVSFLFGFPQMARDIAETTIIQKNAQEKLLAKVYSARGTLLFGTFGLSSLVMGWLTEKFGVRAVFFVATILFLTSFIIALLNKSALLGAEIKKNRT